MALVITNSNVNEVLAGDKPVVIDFWAQWCGPCKALAPTVEELAKEYEGQVVIAKCDIEETPELPEKYGIRNIPTLLFFKNGEVVDKSIGMVKKNVLEDKIKGLL